MSDLKNRPFSAVSICPECNTVAVHAMREPCRRPAMPRREDFAGDPKGYEFAVTAWIATRSLFSIGFGIRPTPSEEDVAEVVRVCACGTAWAEGNVDV
jgi:hypothetical protein